MGLPNDEIIARVAKQVG